MGYHLWKWRHAGLDTSDFDEADANVKKFEKLLGELDEHLGYIKFYRETADDYYTNTGCTLSSCNAGTAGHLLDFYVKKVDQWWAYKGDYYGRISSEIEAAFVMRSIVAGKIRYWREVRDNEANDLDDKLEEIESHRENEYR